MIYVESLKKQYANTIVLDIPSLQIESGECIGLVGNNGAGKTTFFNILLDLIYPSEGIVKNNDIVVQISEDWKTFTNAFIDESFLIGYLTPEEYFCFIGEAKGMPKEEVNNFLSQYHDFFNNEILGHGKYLRDFSKGNQKKVGIIAALMGAPKVVILDEPFANLDPTTQFRLKKLIKVYTELHPEVIMLISSHDLMHTVDVSTRIIALNKGQIVLDKIKNEESLAILESFFAIE